MNGARFSPCGRYRYVLTRDVSILNPRLVNFVMLNPSTADATVDDPTIRRCIGYARAWDYGHLVVTNLFAYRATDPRALKSEDDPVGPDNGEYIATWATHADLIVVAWGAHGAYLDRSAAVLAQLRAIGKVPHYLARTKRGQPCHPLYLPADLQPLPLDQEAPAHA